MATIEDHQAAGRCCTGKCHQGPACPLRSPFDAPRAEQDRRKGPSIMWKLFARWLPERRSGFDRRQRQGEGGQ